VIEGTALIVLLVIVRRWLYHGPGRWIGVPIPRNVIQLRRVGGRAQ
jgi:hypothetical protein